MANLWFEGFEVLSTAYLRNKLTSVSNCKFATNASLLGPRSSQSIGTTSTGNNGYCYKKTGWSAKTRLFAGFRFVLPALHSTTHCEYVFFDGDPHASGVAKVGIKLNSAGSISAYLGDTTAAALIGTTATGLFPIGGVTSADMKMLEAEVIFHASAGTVRLKLAGVEVGLWTGISTSASGSAQCTHSGLWFEGNSNENVYDDCYVNDDSGSAPHETFYGEALVIEKVAPNANGNSSQWLGSDGNSVNNFQLVDDNGNDDTDYVASATAAETDTYGCNDLGAASGTVIGVEQTLIAKKDDVATREIAGVLRTGGTDHTQTTRVMSGSYQVFHERVDTNPDTSLPWTIANINGLEIGVKVIT